MRVTISLLGMTLDLSLEPTAPPTEGSSLDGGTTGGYYVGFARHDGVLEPMPQRVPPWDEPEE